MEKRTLKRLSLLFLMGALLILSSCSKCRTCTTKTTITDLNDNPLSSSWTSFPVCERKEFKYYDGRKTDVSKGTYKEKTFTTCD